MQVMTDHHRLQHPYHQVTPVLSSQSLVFEKLVLAASTAPSWMALAAERRSQDERER
jgi:hypothetical protein